jgi:regulator of sigma E protease
LDGCLIAVLGGTLDLLSTVGSYALTILIVAVTLGLVIFVHELGHFVVAKLCGVKVEKFYLGFDIYGLKFFRFRRGETEYGIGILPLGGYVKMLGQEDNPARLREEIERAKQPPLAALQDPPLAASQEPPLAASQEPPCEAACEEEIEHAEQALYDPRSYLAKSVPRRMAIISAGVVMNLVFAFVCATVAYRIGVRQFPCGVGEVYPGMGAWQIGLQPDDQILEIAGKPMHNFEDLRKAVALGDNLADGLAIVVRRPELEEPLELTVTPDKSRGMPLIGISNPRTTALWKAQERGSFPAWPGSPAAQAEPAFEPGDRFIALDGRPVERYRDIHRYFAHHTDRPVEVTVARTIESDDGAGGVARSEQRLTITVQPAPMRRLGLVMRIGPVAAVQAGSPAAKADIRPGDVLTEIDGRPLGDPMTLPDRLRRRAGETVTLGLRRPDESGKRSQTIQMELTLREPDGFAVPVMSTSPLEAPALGLAYQVTSTVESVLPGSPAEKAGLAPGDVVTAATVIPPKPLPEGLPFEPEEQTVQFTETRPAWPMLLYTGLANSLPGTEVKLTWTRGDGEHTETLVPYASSDWFHVDRGFAFQAEYFHQTAGSWTEAVAWGFDETVRATLTVYRFLEKLRSRDISPRMMAGPIGIIRATAHFAERGLTDLLIFVTLLSANLAVINFLPIPLLDGGHMVFLAYEGIRGKPADERVQTVLTYIGLFLLLTLLVWVFGLDLGLISREVP